MILIRVSFVDTSLYSRNEMSSQDNHKQILDRIKKNKENEDRQITFEVIANATPFTENHVLTPTLLARISPFKPLKRGQERIFHEDEQLFRNKFGYITYTGKTLGIDDQDVFLQLLKLGREQLFAQDPAITIEISIKKFLKLLGRSSGGKQSQLLKQSLKRLTGASITVCRKGGDIFSGVFLTHWIWDDDLKKCVVDLNPKIAEFYYRSGGYTQVDFRQRLQLRGDITKALHLFLSSQRNKKEKFQFECSIQELAGILNLDRYSENYKLRQVFKTALSKLQDQGFLSSFSFEKDQLKLRMTPF